MAAIRGFLAYDDQTLRSVRNYWPKLTRAAITAWLISVSGACGETLNQKCYPPGSKAAAWQHKRVCTALYPRVTPPRYVTVIPTSNIYHEHALAKFRYWYQEKTPLNKQCCKLTTYYRVGQKSKPLYCDRYFKG